MKNYQIIFLAMVFISQVTVFQSYAQVNRSSFRTSEQVIDVEELADRSVIFLYDDYVSARVHYPGKYSEVELNYRILADEFIVKVDDDNHKSLSVQELDSIVTEDNKLFIRHPSLGFVEQIGTDDQSFYIKYNTSYTMNEIRPGAYGDAPVTSSTQSVQHLGRLGDHAGHSRTDRDLRLTNASGNPVQLNLVSKPVFIMHHEDEYKNVISRRELLRMFPRSYRSDINSFVRQENISFDEREDLIKLSDFLKEL